MDLTLEIPAWRAVVTALKTISTGESNIYALADTAQRIMASVNRARRAAICRANRSKQLASVSLLYMIGFLSINLLLVA